jgi:hypothetical protein
MRDASCREFRASFLGYFETPNAASRGTAEDAAVERVVRTDELTASHPNSNWVFHGYSPGRHIHGSSLRSRLKTVFSTRAARLGTLHELTKLGPVPIIADALGYHPSTIERHAFGSASTYAEYIAAARELRQTS